MTIKQPKTKKTQPAAEPLTAPESGNTIKAKKAVDTPVKQTKAADKKPKKLKEKVIRDSFSFPEEDYLKISQLKKSCLAEGIHVKKSELLRAGLHLLQQLSMAKLKQAIEQVEKVKTGRPNSSRTS